MQLFDAHTHIQDLRMLNCRAEVVKRSIDAGVERIMCCGTRENDWSGVVDMVTTFESVIPSFGIHPWFVEDRSSEWRDKLEELLKQHPHAGVGEIGLDRMTGYRNDKEQEQIFIEQLKLSHKYERPVSIHCRTAWGVMPEMIRANGGFPVGAVIHSWSGSAEMVKVFESLGASISFSGSVTRGANKKAHKACQAVSSDRLMIETDSPDILPDGIDAELNEPAYLVRILKAVSQLRGESEASIAETIWNNSVTLFERRRVV